MQPLPAPSLRELSSESETEGVYYDEWRNAPFVGAMKIARSVAAFGRYVEWHSPFPAPSLRELSSESETEGVSPDEWERLTIQSFVGAMKIARNLAVSQVPG